MVVKTNIYAGPLEEAYQCVCLFGLTQCDPVPEPIWVYEFPGNAALVAFVLACRTEGWAGGNTLIIPDRRKNDANDTLQHLSIRGVQSAEVFALEVWGDGDEAVFDALFT